MACIYNYLAPRADSRGFRSRNVSENSRNCALSGPLYALETFKEVEKVSPLNVAVAVVVGFHLDSAKPCES